MNKIDLLVDRMNVARQWTQSLLDSLDQTRWFDMPADGVGHVAWQVGHIAASQIALIPMRTFGHNFTDYASESFLKTFGKGSTPVADRGAYPSIPEILDSFGRIHTTVIDMVSCMAKHDLKEPNHGGQHPLFSTKEGAIATAAMHETFHAGQIALIRRLAGLPPLR